MLHSLTRVSASFQRFYLQTAIKQLTNISTRPFLRSFANDTIESETILEETPVEEITEPLSHNKFRHRGALVFEHTKDKEPTTVGEDDWFAIIKLSGTQYKIGEDDILFTNKLQYDIGQQIILNNVLLLGSKHRTIIGNPFVANAKVLCTVEQQVKEKKVIVFKYHKRNRYQKKQGFRRQLTALRIDEIVF